MRFLQPLLVFLFISMGLNAQNIGIGTTNPDFTLDINGSLGINDFIYHNDDGDDTWMGFPGNNEWELVLNNKQVVFADGIGKEFILNQNGDDVDFIIVADGIEHLIHAKTDQQRVGIGKTNPDFLLDVNGTMGISDFIVHNDDIDTKMGFPANDEWELLVMNQQMIKADGTSKELIINPNNDDVKFVIVSDGIEHLFTADTYNKYIGIGTSNPQYAFDVAGDFRVIGDQIEHVFFFDGSTGRVGIGTESPTQDLDVNGALKVQGLQVSSDPANLFSNIQRGFDVLTSNSPDGLAKQITVNFPSAFIGTPMIVATAVNISTTNNRTYGVSVRSINNTSVTFNIDLLGDDGDDAWTDDIQINWMAWE